MLEIRIGGEVVSTCSSLGLEDIFAQEFFNRSRNVIPARFEKLINYELYSRWRL